MRRGRPVKTDADLKGIKPSPSPMRGSSDPFAALDAGVPGSALVDEVSSRYPPLDEFSLLHDSGTKFAFGQKPESAAKPATKDINQRVTEALADDVFAQSTASKRLSAIRSNPVHQATGSGPKSQPEPNDNSGLTAQKETSAQPAMVSTGTMTSPSPPPPVLKNASLSRPIYRFPPSPEIRSSSLPRASDASIVADASLRADALGKPRPGLLDHRSKSQIGTLAIPRSPVSSRPSLEGRRPSKVELDSTVSRSRSTNSKVRPTSVHLEPKRSFFRSRDQSRGDSPQEDEPRRSYDPGLLPSAFVADVDIGTEATKITSNVDFLRAMEEEEPSKKKEKRLSSGSRHVKRASMPSISLSGTKSLLAGRFGDAFRRFETNTSISNQRPSSPPPDRSGRELTPIAGSEATDERSDDGRAMDESEEIPPEMRRELERRRLDQVEKQVAGAAAAYRERFNDRSASTSGLPNAPNRAASIQSKVKTLLHETGRASPSSTKPDRRQNPDFSSEQTPQRQSGNPARTSSLPISRRPPSNGIPSQAQQPSESHLPISRQQPPTTSSQNARTSAAPPSRPLPPSKPQALRTGERAPPSPAKPPSLAANKMNKSLPQRPLDGTTDTPVMGDEDWELQFSKKYPSLAGLEMVETEIDGRARDV